MMPRILMSLTLWLALLVPGVVQAQDAVPKFRFVYTQDVDFFGADLGNLFNTTRDACARSCAAQPTCVAFTFNTRSNACFPKSAISDRKPYQGALSAVKMPTRPDVLAASENRLQAIDYLDASDLANAAALVQQNASRHPVGSLTAGDLIASMEAAFGRGEFRAALRWMGGAIAATDRSDLWARKAWVGLRENDGLSRDERRRLRREAIPAAINAYLRSPDTAGQITALELLARGLEANGRGRDMIAALRQASALAPRQDLDEMLDRAIAKYGFRVIEHKVNSDAAAPRICAEFSERLVQAGVDYEPFVKLDADGLAIAVDGKELCVDGVIHGVRYQMTLRKGLPAASGEQLHRDVDLRLYVRDRAPAVRFSGRAFVLPRTGQAALPVETVNTDRLDLVLRKVSDRNLVRSIQDNYFGRPLAKYQEDQFAETLAQEIWSGTGEVLNMLNEDMTTRLPMTEALIGQAPGIYALTASVPGQDPYETPAATQWFVLSDLGLSAWSGTDGVHVAVRGLGDAGPREGVTLSLISRANTVLGITRSDAAGFASFPAGLSRGTGASAPALVMAEIPGKDVAFLPLTEPAFDLSDRGVEGHPPAPPIDTFLATDRGAYRVGETVHATVLTRNAQADALKGLPVVAVLNRPDGVEYTRTLSQNSKAGGHVFALPLGPDVPRGAWRLDILADPADGPLASQTILVEDFLPERIDVDLALPDAPLRLEDTPPLSVNVRYLFGAPGADLEVEGDVRLRSVRELEGWSGYQFGAHDQPFDPRTRVLDPAITDATGAATLPLRLPDLSEDPGQPLQAEVTVRVAEGSGRPVERQLTRSLQASGPMIGIKPGFDDVLSEGAEAVFDIVAVGPDGTAIDMPVRWTLNKVRTRYQWYQIHGDWEWEPIVSRTRLDMGELRLGRDPLSLRVPTEWGEYELVVEHLGAAFAVSSVTFSSGWYGGGDASDTPDRLDVSLDSKSYDRGDTATLRVVTDTPRMAIVSILSNRVISRDVVTLNAGENSLPLSVTEAWGSGAYVTVSALRAMDVQDGLNPARSLGLAHASVRPGRRKLDVAIAAAPEIDGQPGTSTVSVEVDGITAGETAYVTLAAVDVGILNLTGFAAPDPVDHYFGQRRLGVEMRDVYGRLIDGLNGAMGTVRSGGDASRTAGLQSPPPTEDLMAFFAGPVPVGADGRAEISIERPAFNGTIRLMAVVWSETAVGQASKDVLARDPVVVAASLPRVLAPSDRSRLLLEFNHATGPAGPMALQVHADAGVALGDVPDTIDLTPQGAARLEIPITARELGDNKITVILTPPGGKPLRKVLQMPVRDSDPETAVTRQFALGPGESFTFDANVFAGMRPGTASATLSAGPLARFDVPGLLRRLDRYPYGCTEQVTSAALPLLYLSGMAEKAGVGAPRDLDQKISGAIEKVLSRQAGNGAFGLWRAESGEFWLDAYVTDFLWRARENGHSVHPRALSQAMDNLRNRISYAPDFDEGGEDLAYALLVLARAGAANMGDLRYYADTKGNAFATPLAAAQLGAALAAYGDPSRADRMFSRAAQLLAQNRSDQGWRDDFGTNLRDAAAVMRLAAEAGSARVDAAQLSARLTRDNRHLSTQEAAQLVLAAHALSQPGAASGLLVDGTPPTGPVVQQLSDQSPRRSIIQNISNAAMDVTMTTFGVADVPADAGGYGYAITRRLFSMDGKQAEGPLRSGDRFVVVLDVTPFEEIGARLIIDDPLPGGLEIDNPNLLRGGDVKELDWLKPATAEHAEFRSDRFIAAVNHSGSNAFQLAYVARAVTPGTYHHSAATVEDMYRPEYRANTVTGEIVVTE